jgi:hypothetical protein
LIIVNAIEATSASVHRRYAEAEGRHTVTVSSPAENWTTYAG